MQPAEHRLGGAHGVLDAGAAQPLEQQALHGQPHLGGVPVARQVDQAGEEPAERVAAEEQPGLAPLAQVQDGERDRQQLVHGDLQQLVAGIGLQDVEQLLARVAVRRHPRAGQHLRGGPAHQRHVAHAAGVGLVREEADQPLLALPAAVGGQRHRHHVQPGGPVHGGPGVALGDHQPLAGHHVGGGQPGRDDGGAGVHVAAQHPEAGARDRRRPPAGQQLDGAGTEEDEVAVRQPAQQLGGLVQVRLPGRVRQPVQRVGERAGPRSEPVGVLVDGADVGQHGAQPDDQVGRGLLVDRPLQHDGHPGLRERVRAAAGGIGAVAEGQQPAGDVTAHHDDRVDDVVQPDALTDDLGGHRVHQERHVVGDDP